MSATLYTVRWQLPTSIVRGQDTTITAPLYRDGALVAPTAGTVTVYDRAGAAVASPSVSIVSSVATATVTGATTATLEPEDGWRVEWSLTVTGEPDDVLARNDAGLNRRDLYPVVTDADLFRRASSLDPSGGNPLTARADFQDYIDEAWISLMLRVIEAGNRPNLIMTPSSLREAHLALTLALIFEDFATRLNEAFSERADGYRRQYESAYRRLNFRYDTHDTGEQDTEEGRRSATPTLWLHGGGRRRYGSY
jgi:hypothetical protein